MKKLVLIITLLFIGTTYSQENLATSNFSFHSASITPLGLFDEGNIQGLFISGDVSFALYNDHLLSLGLSAGTEAEVVFEEYNDHFEQINFLYGREFHLNRRVFADIHAGLGYFSYKSEDLDGNRNTVTQEASIGFPVVAKVRFMASSRFSLGLQLQANFNSVNTVIGAGIVIQWNHKRKW